MDQKEDQLRTELAELDKKLQDPSVFSDPSYPKLAKRKSQLDDILALFEERTRLQKNMTEARQMITEYQGTPEFIDMAEGEISFVQPQLEKIEAALVKALTPQDPNNDHDVIIEIRAAAGGDESALFAGELYRMYIRWAENHNYKTELINESPSEAGVSKKFPLWYVVTKHTKISNSKLAYIVYSAYQPPRARVVSTPLRLPLRFCQKPKKRTLRLTRMTCVSMCTAVAATVVKA
jgi:protein subunit release factor A